MKDNKIKGLLALNNKNNSDFAEYLNKSKQFISNKMRSQVWSVDEFILLAELTNTTLAFIDNENNVIIKFDKSDLKE